MNATHDAYGTVRNYSMFLCAKCDCRPAGRPGVEGGGLSCGRFLYVSMNGKMAIRIGVMECMLYALGEYDTIPCD